MERKEITHPILFSLSPPPPPEDPSSYAQHSSVVYTWKNSSRHLRQCTFPTPAEFPGGGRVTRPTPSSPLRSCRAPRWGLVHLVGLAGRLPRVLALALALALGLRRCVSLSLCAAVFFTWGMRLGLLDRSGHLGATPDAVARGKPLAHYADAAE